MCVLWCHEPKSPLTVQRKYRNDYRRLPADVKNIKAWHSKFVENGNVGDHDRSGRPSVSAETVGAVREAFQRTPGKPTRRDSSMLKCTNVL